MSKEHIATELIRRIATEIVLHPENLEVKEVQAGAGIEITIRAHQGDKPRLIGPQGSQFRALSILAKLIGINHQKFINLPDILQSIVGEPDRYPLFQVKDEWPRERFEKLTRDLAHNIFRGSSTVAIEDHNEGGNGATTVTIYVEKNESPRIVAQALEALNKLLNSGGRNQGRIISVRIIPADEIKTERQPTSANGRFAPAVRR